MADARTTCDRSLVSMAKSMYGTPKMPGEPPRVQPSKKVAANWDDEGNPV